MLREVIVIRGNVSKGIATLFELLGKFLMSLIPMAVTFLYACKSKRFRVSGNSMEPVLCDGQIVWASMWAYKFTEPRSGDVVVFRDPGQPSIVLIKEVVGEPGQNVHIDSQHEGVQKAWYLLEGQYFVTGRNHANSRDSRQFGPITSHLLIGKVWR